MGMSHEQGEADRDEAAAAGAPTGQTEEDADHVPSSPSGAGFLAHGQHGYGLLRAPIHPGVATRFASAILIKQEEEELTDQPDSAAGDRGVANLPEHTEPHDEVRFEPEQLRLEKQTRLWQEAQCQLAQHAQQQCQLEQQQQQVVGQVTTPSAGTGETAASHVLGNVGLSDFLVRVYKTTSLSVAVTLAVSDALVSLFGPVATAPALIGGLLLTLGAVFYMGGSRPTAQRDASGRLQTVNPASRQLAFATFVGGNSLMLVPLVLMTSAIHPFIIPVAAGAAGLTMLGSSLYAYKQPNGSMLSLAAPMTGALVASVALGLGGMAASAIIGPNIFSSVVFSVYPYVSIGIFSVLTAVDTHTAIREYEQGSADHLWHAVGFYLNFINLLTSFARIISDIVRD